MMGEEEVEVDGGGEEADIAVCGEEWEGQEEGIKEHGSAEVHGAAEVEAAPVVEEASGVEATSVVVEAAAVPAPNTMGIGWGLT